MAIESNKAGNVGELHTGEADMQTLLYARTHGDYSLSVKRRRIGPTRQVIHKYSIEKSYCFIRVRIVSVASSFVETTSAVRRSSFTRFRLGSIWIRLFWLDAEEGFRTFTEFCIKTCSRESQKIGLSLPNIRSKLPKCDPSQLLVPHFRFAASSHG